VLKGNDFWARVRATEALGKIGPGAEDAVPELLERIADTSGMGYSKSVGSALARIGEPAVPGLVHRSENNAGEPGILAALALSVVDPGNTRALPRTVETLRDERDVVRELAVLALRLRRPLPAESVAALLGVLNRPFESGGVRREVLATLGVLIPQSPDALRALIRATQDEDEWVALAAVRALGEAEPTTRSTRRNWTARV